MIQLLAGDCRDVLPTLAADSVQCVVTSPPYYGLRDYGTALWDGGDAACDHKANGGASASSGLNGSLAHKDGRIFTPYRDTCGKCGATRIDRQIGLEATPDEYLATMVAVFRELRRVLRPDGTCWVNMGDSYAHGPSHDGSVFRNGRNDGRKSYEADKPRGREVSISTLSGAKPKDLLMMPARLALALQADGWWLRSDIIWHKPNPMPESVTDRCVSAHEHVFLLTKMPRYYFDSIAIAEPATHGELYHGAYDKRPGATRERNGRDDAVNVTSTRSCRNVWTIATHAYPQAHFATYPPELAERCIRAGTRPGDTVLDPFAGAGTTLLVADRLQRDAIGIELSPDYTRMAMQRCQDDAPLFTSFPPAETDAQDERMRDLFREAAD